MGKSFAEWATSDLLLNQAHLDILDEFVKLNMLTKKAFIVDLTAASGAVLKTDLGIFSSLHWSRVFEYPWAILNGELNSNDFVLDAAGGDGLLQFYLASNCRQVINVDMNLDDVSETLRTPFLGRPLRYYFPNICLEEGDISKLCQIDKHGNGISENSLDKIFCISVLEHVQDVEGCISTLLKVIKPGGFLIGTVDIAPIIRHNHTIDLVRITKILAQYGVQVPICPTCSRIPQNVLSHTFDEDKPLPGESTTVELNVLCFKIYK